MKQKKVTKKDQRTLLSKSKKKDFNFILNEYPLNRENIYIPKDLWDQLCKNLFLTNNEQYSVKELFDLYDKLTKFGILYKIQQEITNEQTINN